MKSKIVDVMIALCALIVFGAVFIPLKYYAENIMKTYTLSTSGVASVTCTYSSRIKTNWQQGIVTTHEGVRYHTELSGYRFTELSKADCKRTTSYIIYTDSYIKSLKKH